MRSKISVTALFLAFGTVASAKAPVQPTEPAEHPSWNEAAQHAVSQLRGGLRDPESAIITWTSGFKWGFTKPVFGRRNFAWVACGRYNAKNGFGGYVGESPFFVAVQPDGRFVFDQQNIMISTCDEHPAAPVNPELINAVDGRRESRAPLSVADELRKLAELKNSGILTPQEFEAQKAKLLSQ